MTLPFSVHEDAELELNEAADLENQGLGSTLIDDSNEQPPRFASIRRLDL